MAICVVFVVITLVDATFFVSSRTVALCVPGEKAEQARDHHGNGIGIGQRRPDKYHDQETGQHHAFQPQRPGDRCAAAALDHDRERGCHDCRQQEDRYRQHLGHGALFLGDKGRRRQHEAARDLRHEHSEQRQDGETVDETGCETQQRWKRGWNRLRPRSKNLAHDISRPTARSRKTADLRTRSCDRINTGCEIAIQSAAISLAAIKP
jgi:hypothetical protein